MILKKYTNIIKNILCTYSKDNHKKIIIGKKGQMIKNIGIKSRELIENYLGKKIHLSLFVVVKDNWKNNPTILKDIGYID